MLEFLELVLGKVQQFLVELREFMGCPSSKSPCKLKGVEMVNDVLWLSSDSANTVHKTNVSGSFRSVLALTKCVYLKPSYFRSFCGSTLHTIPSQYGHRAEKAFFMYIKSNINNNK